VLGSKFRATEKRPGISSGGRASVRAGLATGLGPSLALPNSPPYLRGARRNGGARPSSRPGRGRPPYFAYFAPRWVCEVWVPRREVWAPTAGLGRPGRGLTARGTHRCHHAISPATRPRAAPWQRRRGGVEEGEAPCEPAPPTGRDGGLALPNADPRFRG